MIGRSRGLWEKHKRVTGETGKRMATAADCGEGAGTAQGRGTCVRGVGVRREKRWTRPHPASGRPKINDAAG